MTVAPILFLASVGVSLVSVYLTETMWASLSPTFAYTRGRYPGVACAARRDQEGLLR